MDDNNKYNRNKDYEPRLRFLQGETTPPKDLQIFRRITAITLTMM